MQCLIKLCPLKIRLFISSSELDSNLFLICLNISYAFWYSFVYNVSIMYFSILSKIEEFGMSLNFWINVNFTLLNKFVKNLPLWYFNIFGNKSSNSDIYISFNSF